MMYNSVLAVFLLEAGLVLSKPYGANGVVESGPAPVARDNIQSLSAYRPPPPPYTSITGPMGSLPFIRCYFSVDGITIPTARPVPDGDVLGFCSNYIQPSATITKTQLGTSVIATATVTETAKVTGTTTITNGVPGSTQTALCPIAATGQTCGYGGWGYATNNIYSGSLDAQACHQLCLSKSDCASFQILANSTDPVAQCNLYKVPAGGNNTIPGTSSPYLFYDRGCPDLSPAGCGLATTTKAPALPKRDDLAHTVIPPWFLSTLPSQTLSSICSCIIRAPLPTAFVTQTVIGGSFGTTSVTKTVVEYYTVTSVVGGGIGGTVTSYSSVRR